MTLDNQDPAPRPLNRARLLTRPLEGLKEPFLPVSGDARAGVRDRDAHVLGGWWTREVQALGDAPGLSPEGVRVLRYAVAYAQMQDRLVTDLKELAPTTVVIGLTRRCRIAS